MTNPRYIFLNRHAVARIQFLKEELAKTRADLDIMQRGFDAAQKVIMEQARVIEELKGKEGEK